MTTSAPTAKQVSYLASLWKISEHDIWREIGQRWNVSPSSARRRATKSDFSAFIEEAKK